MTSVRYGDSTLWKAHAISEQIRCGAVLNRENLARHVEALESRLLAQAGIIEAARQKLGRFPEMNDAEAAAAAGDIAAMLFDGPGVEK